MALLVGVDTGGTFTDFFAFDNESGRTYVHKTPSTPHNPASAIVDGLSQLLADNKLEHIALDLVAQGTTVGTNALLERKGARVSFVTTEGFRDLLEIGRQTRPSNYDMQLDHAPPVVPRARRHCISERLDFAGNIVTALTDAEIERVVDIVLEEAPAAVAICLLFAYINPAHEKRIADAFRQRAPALSLSLSSEVQPEFREYERFTTTTLNAYLQPVMAQYLDFLRDKIEAAFPGTEIAISRSNGGLMSLEKTRQFPIRSALSGPAAGVVGAIGVQRSVDTQQAITFDMGGTSADVALLQNMSPNYKYETNIGGFPVRLPMIDIHTVGAGGGSIAWFDRDGLLKVGPQSAGAQPGPACYGHGGTNPTVSDANAVLGRLSPEGLLNGQMSLDVTAARRVIQALADQLSLSVEAAAIGILDIVVANMVRAIRTISIERGFDPREMSLIAFGGAGPLHARDVAAALGMRQIIIPPSPGILCAKGLLYSPFKEDFVRAARISLSDSAALAKINDALAQLFADAADWVDEENLPKSDCRAKTQFDMRYRGQNFELGVQLDSDRIKIPALKETTALCDAFHKQHEHEYGHSSHEQEIEIINIRMTVEGYKNPSPNTTKASSSSKRVKNDGHRPVFFNATAAEDTPIFNRSLLSAEDRITGPAIVHQLDTTTPIFPNDTVSIDKTGNLIIEVNT